MFFSGIKQRSMKVIEVVENVNKQNKQKNVYMLESVDCVVYLFSTILNNF